MIRALITAFAFLTRLPVLAGPVSDRDLGRAVGFFPLVGLVLGLMVTGLGYWLAGTLPSVLGAVLLVSLLAALTGALHLDGISDLFDGLAGGHGDRERILAIMRDSRIGAQGAVALVLVLMAKIAAVSVLLEGRDFLSLLAFPVIARFAVVPQIVLFRYTRPEGLGRAFNGEARIVELVMATVTMTAVAFALGPTIAKQAGAALGMSMLLAFWLRSRLGGLTGDVYGATIEITEAVALFVAALR
jgi:adenosylcobinamide-GDP ribazoletransferase